MDQEKNVSQPGEFGNEVKPGASGKKKKKITVIILLIVLAVLLLAGGVFGYIYYTSYKSNKDYESKINAMWSEIADKSNTFGSNLNNPTKVDDLKKLNTEAQELETLLTSKTADINNLKTPQNYGESKNKLIKALENYNNYIYNLQKHVLNNNIARVEVTNDFNKVAEYENNARGAITDFTETNRYINKSINDNVFNLIPLKDFIKNWQTKKAAEAAAAAAAQAAAQRQAATAAAKAAAQEAATEFMQKLPSAYSFPVAKQWTEAQFIAGNYWYSPAMSNFDNDYMKYFTNQTGTSFVNYGSGQVISSTEININKFNVSAEEIEKTLQQDPSTKQMKVASETKYLSYFIVERINGGWHITSHGRR